MGPSREVIFKPPVCMFNSSRSGLKRCFKPAAFYPWRLFRWLRVVPDYSRTRSGKPFMEFCRLTVG